MGYFLDHPNARVDNHCINNLAVPPFETPSPASNRG